MQRQPRVNDRAIDTARKTGLLKDASVRDFVVPFLRNAVFITLGTTSYAAYLGTREAAKRLHEATGLDVRNSVLELTIHGLIPGVVVAATTLTVVEIIVKPWLAKLIRGRPEGRLSQHEDHGPYRIDPK